MKLRREMIVFRRPWWSVRRFVKFGTVGASGVLVNLTMLYSGREWLFRFIAAPELRLNAALGFAILLATLNNFLWNWAWTWKDRKHPSAWPHPVQFCQYVAACGLGIALQVTLTKLLASYCHYLLANMAAIALAGLTNFVASDLMTFRPGKALWRQEGS